MPMHITTTLHACCNGATVMTSVLPGVLGQDNSTKAVIETPPSETWQIKFHPASESLILAAAGGSSSKVAIWSAEDAQSKAHLGIPAVSPFLSAIAPKSMLAAACTIDYAHLDAPWKHALQTGFAEGEPCARLTNHVMGLQSEDPVLSCHRLASAGG